MNNWSAVQLGEHIRVKHGYAFQGKYFGERGQYVVVTPGNFIESGGFKTKSGAEKYYVVTPPDEYVLKRGDLVIAMTEQAHGLLGSSALIPADDTYLHNQRIGLIEQCSSDTDRGFLYYLFNTSTVRNQIQATATGSKVRHTAPVRIESITVQLPPVTTQRKIAAILSTYDDLIDNNNRRIKLLEEIAQRIYREWFVDFRYPGHENVPLVESQLGMIPEGWMPRTLGECCSIMQAGGTPSRGNLDYWTDGTVDWYKTTELQDGFLLTSSERVTELAVAERKTRVFPEGTILMAIYGSPTVGRLGILTSAGSCNQAALAMVGSEIPQEFLYYALVELRTHFNSIAQGAAQQNISKQKVEATPILCPPPEMCLLAEDTIAPFWDQRRILNRATANLRATRDTLLPRLISGEVDVTYLDIAMTEVAA